MMANASTFVPNGLLKKWRRAHCFLHSQASPKDHQPSTSTATCPPPPNSFLGLPLEIKQAICSSLADVASLKALILTCSSLYYAFLKAEHLILAKILQNQIDPAMMHDTLATWKSSQIVQWSRLTAEKVMLLYTTGETSSLLPTWNLRNALAVSELHGHIQFFANDFASSALSQNPVTGLLETDPASASPSELIRIQRSLYRFELYRNLFAERRRWFGGYFEPFTADDQGRYLAAGFAPWENEQLACVHDYLVVTLSKCTCRIGYVLRDSKRLTDPAFNNAADRAIVRGARKVGWAKDWSKEDPTDYLSLGLTRLHHLILANTTKQRNQLLFDQLLTGKNHLHAGLSSQDTFGDSSPSDLTGEEERSLITRQLAADDDPGPRDAWRWAHADSRPAGWYYTRQRDDLRQRAYVMWDSARLARWKILARDWASLPRPMEQERYWVWLSQPDSNRAKRRRWGRPFRLGR